MLLVQKKTSPTFVHDIKYLLDRIINEMKISSNQTFIHLDYIHKRINHFSTDFSLISLPFDPLHPLFAISQISSARHAFADIFRNDSPQPCSKAFVSSIAKYPYSFEFHKLSSSSSSQSRSPYTQRSLRFILLYQCLRPSLSPRSLLSFAQRCEEDEAGRGDIGED